jgi:hypothetical protein
VFEMFVIVGGTLGCAVLVFTATDATLSLMMIERRTRVPSLAGVVMGRFPRALLSCFIYPSA